MAAETGDAPVARIGIAGEGVAAGVDIETGVVPGASDGFDVDAGLAVTADEGVETGVGTEVVCFGFGEGSGCCDACG